MALDIFALGSLFKSKGVKRTLSAALAGLAVVLPYFPATQPYVPLVGQLAGWLGLVGVGHALVAPKAE